MFNALIVDDEPRNIDALLRNVDWRKCGIKNVYRASGMNDDIISLQRVGV